MKPQRIVKRRAPSPLARHTTGHPCNAPQVLEVVVSPFRLWESLVIERCGHCGTRLHVSGVIPEPVQYWADDAWDDDEADDDDPTPWRA